MSLWRILLTLCACGPSELTRAQQAAEATTYALELAACRRQALESDPPHRWATYATCACAADARHGIACKNADAGAQQGDKHP